MNHLITGLGTLLLGGLAAAGWVGELEQLQYAKPVQRPSADQEEILAIVLDAEVYASTQENLADVRVFNSTGAEVPRRLERAADMAVDTLRRPTPSKVTGLETNDADNSIQVLIALQRDAPAADGLTLVTPLENFERRVSVFGSEDGTNWQPLAQDTMIYDYSRFMDLSNRDIPLPSNSYRYFKLVIQDVVDETASTLSELTRKFARSDETQRTERSLIEHRPLRIDRVDLWQAVPQQRVKRNLRADYAVAGFEVEQDTARKATVVHVRTRREPLVQFTLETSSTNFSRTAVVEVPSTRGVQVTWTPVGRATLSRFHFRDFHKEQLAVKFTAQRHAEYRIVIANGDNAPLDITGVQAQGDVYRALILAAPGIDYQLCYGAEKVAAPQYDTAAIDAALAQGYLPVTAALGSQVPNPLFGGSHGFGLAALLDSPLFLGGTIIVMVIVLGLLVFRASRHIDGAAAPEEDTTGGPPPR